VLSAVCQLPAIGTNTKQNRDQIERQKKDKTAPRDESKQARSEIPARGTTTQLHETETRYWYLSRAHTRPSQAHLTINPYHHRHEPSRPHPGPEGRGRRRSLRRRPHAHFDEQQQCHHRRLQEGPNQAFCFYHHHDDEAAADDAHGGGRARSPGSQEGPDRIRAVFAVRRRGAAAGWQRQHPGGGELRFSVDTCRFLAGYIYFTARYAPNRHMAHHSLEACAPPSWVYLCGIYTYRYGKKVESEYSYISSTCISTCARIVFKRRNDQCIHTHMYIATFNINLFPMQRSICFE